MGGCVLTHEDKSVYTFSPYQVQPIQVQNTGASGRDRRMNPTKTAYVVYYRATDGSGYQWTDRAITRELGQEVVDTGAAVERRVLVIPADRSYITVELSPTAKATPPDFGKNTSPPLHWREPMPCCMWRCGV